MSAASAAGAVFVAVMVPIGDDPEVAGAIGRLGRLDAALAIVDPPGLHCTLRFLGRLDNEAVGRAHTALDAVAARTEPFSLTLGGLGAFPDWRGPAVLWLGCGEAQAPIGDLQQEMARALAEQGFGADPRPFRPHCTLARVRRPLAGATRRELAGAASPWPDGARRAIPVPAVRLLRSVPQPRGPARYRTLHHAGLGATATSRRAEP